MLKIACAQPEITAGRPDLNTEKILKPAPSRKLPPDALTLTQKKF